MQQKETKETSHSVHKEDDKNKYRDRNNKDTVRDRNRERERDRESDRREKSDRDTEKYRYFLTVVHIYFVSSLMYLFVF